jgi:hypothetical protein
MERCLSTVHLRPWRPARWQAVVPNPRSRLGAAAEVGPVLGGAGGHQGLFCSDALRPPTGVWSLNLPLDPDSHEAAGQRERRCERPTPHAQHEHPQELTVSAPGPRGGR